VKSTLLSILILSLLGACGRSDGDDGSVHPPCDCSDAPVPLDDGEYVYRAPVNPADGDVGCFDDGICGRDASVSASALVLTFEKGGQIYRATFDVAGSAYVP
jgi:hypothetical protein